MTQSRLTSLPGRLLLLLLSVIIYGSHAQAQGTWSPLLSAAPDYNQGVMILMTDGTVLCKTSAGGADNIGNVWDKLTPDINGSYKNGTWTRITSMADTRLYFSSQVLKNGSLYVAGGEYGTGRTMAEVYYPIADYWAPCPALQNAADTISDANSEILPDGKVLQAVVSSGHAVTNRTYIYNPMTNTFSNGAPTFGYANESAWVKLKDNSILFVDVNTTNAERYIPATHSWVHDANVPVGLYDPYGYETGAAIMLPDGRAFFIGAEGHTAYYTSSGSASPGSWTAGPMIPNSHGAPDAAAAMMVNGKVLCAFSDIPVLDTVFHTPMTFYEFDYVNDTFIKITAPDGGDTSDAPCYFSNMLCLPDGNILYGSQGDDQYYIYTPDAAPLAIAKPTITNIIKGDCADTLLATGTLFNGITEGAGYGDDWQMATNYPIIRLSRNDTVYYATTYNWNSTGIMRGTAPDTTQFVLPIGLPDDTYLLQVVANGNASDPVPFTVCVPGAVHNVANVKGSITVQPNPASGVTTVVFTSKDGGEYYITLTDMYGRVVKEHNGNAVRGENRYDLLLGGVAKGMYTVSVYDGNGVYNTKVVVAP